MTARDAWLAVLLSGCVTQAEGERMKADMTAMRAQLDSVKQGIDADRDALQKAIARAEEKTKELEDTLEHFNTSARRTDADFGMQMDKLQQNVQEASGKLEEAQFRLERLEKQGATQPQPAGAAREPAANPGVQIDTRAKLPADKAQARQLVVQLLGRGSDREHDEGKRLSAELLQKWPKEEGTSDVVRLALGDRFADDKLYQKAQVEYKKVLDEFPKGSRADDAMYKIAQAFVAQGQYEDAKVFLEELLRRWPKSPLAKESKAKLAQIQLKEAEAKKKPVPKKK